MLLTPLWHTQCLVDIHSARGENVRILIDSWLSDFVVGDFMARSTRLTNIADIRPDIVYLSHAHTDHFDPYSILALARWNPDTVWLVAETIEYLAPLLREYIPSIRIEIIHHDEMRQIHGIDFTARSFAQESLTNEEDVLALVISSHQEIVCFEIDTMPVMDEDHTWLYERFMDKKYTSRAYIKSRNEIEGMLPLLDAQSDRERQSLKKAYVRDREESMEYERELRMERKAENRDISALPNYLEWYIGQGLSFPMEISSSLASVGSLSLTDVVALESRISRDIRATPFLPGSSYSTNAWVLKRLPLTSGIEFSSLAPQYVSLAPGEFLQRREKSLSARACPRKESEQRLIETIQQRFLPYWHARDGINFMRSLLGGKVYTIGIRYTDMSGDIVGYQFSFSSPRSPSILEKVRFEDCSEVYFMSDLIDFLEWYQELYSSFLHALDPKKTYRLWTCLGANGINDDLAQKKMRLHFERAQRGESAESFVLPKVRSAFWR